MDNPPPPAKVAKSSITADVSTAKKSDVVSSSSAATKRSTTMPMSTTVIGTASNNAVQGSNAIGRVAVEIPAVKVGAISNTSRYAETSVSVSLMALFCGKQIYVILVILYRPSRLGNIKRGFWFM